MPQRSIVWSEMQCHRIMQNILDAGVVHVRNVTGGEPSFPYTSKYIGPIYIGLKELIGRPDLFDSLITFLADKVRKELPCPVRFLAGTATGGIVPAYEIAKKLRRYWNRKGVPAGYVRDQAKDGEWLVGVRDNPLIHDGDSCILIEELVNFGKTTIQSVRVLREAGYKVKHVACFLWYDNPRGIEALKREGIEAIYLFTMAQLLNMGQERGLYPVEVLDECREFLRDPVGWSEQHQTFQRSCLIVLDEEDGIALFQKLFLSTLT